MPTGFLQNVFADALLIGLPVLVLFLERRRLLDALQQLGFAPIGLRKFLRKTVFLFAALMAAAIGLLFVISGIGLNDLESVAETVSVLKMSVPLLAYAMVVRPLGEEVFFRGLLVRKTGVLISSALFAAFHALYFSVAEVIGAFVLGLILAKAFQLNKNLYPNIVAHICYNLAAIALFY